MPTVMGSYDSMILYHYKYACAIPLFCCFCTFACCCFFIPYTFLGLSSKLFDFEKFLVKLSIKHTAIERKFLILGGNCFSHIILCMFFFFFFFLLHQTISAATTDKIFEKKSSFHVKQHTINLGGHVGFTHSIFYNRFNHFSL